MSQPLSRPPTASQRGGVRVWLCVLLAAAAVVLLPRASASAETFGWLDQFGTSTGDSAGSVSVDGLGNAYAAGYTDGALPGQTASGGLDAFVRKYDAAGAVVFTSQFGTGDYDTASSVAANNAAAYVVGLTAGTLPGETSSGYYDAFVRKYDPSGNVVWTRQFGTSAYDSADRVALDASGDVYVAGSTGGALPGQSAQGAYDGFVRKYDSNGNLIWTVQFGTPSLDTAVGIAVTPSGTALVVGSTYGTLSGETSSGDLDAFLTSVTAGVVDYHRQFGSAGGDWSFAVAVDSSSNAYLSGGTTGALPGETASGAQRDAFVRKYNSSGVEQWTTQYGNGAITDVYDISSSAAGAVAIAGLTDGTFPGMLTAGGYTADVDASTGALSDFWGAGSGNDIKALRVMSANLRYMAGSAQSALPGETHVGGFDAWVGAFYQDRDGIAEPPDNCPLDPNPLQENNDADAQGDACDPDDDNDGEPDVSDNCDFVPNSGQENNDADADGDGCDPDDDNDVVLDLADNCPGDYNPLQENNDRNFIDLPPSKAYDDLTLANSDGAGDACDTDDDNDGRSDADEATGAGCAGIVTNALIADSDGDRALDGAECASSMDPSSSASKPSPTQCVFLSGAVGQPTDSDGDGVNNWIEYCYYNTNPFDTDTDDDLIGSTPPLRVCSDGKEIASVNLDATVNATDLQQVAGSFGNSTQPQYIVDFDTNKDGTIGAIDLGFVAQRFGSCPLP